MRKHSKIPRCLEQHCVSLRNILSIAYDCLPPQISCCNEAKV
jgi:hypothetical protein